MRVPAVFAVSAMVLLVGAFDAPAEEPPPAPATATPEEELSALRAAFEAKRWEEVLERAPRCFEGPEDWECRWWASAMAARAAYALEMWERCAHFSRLCSELQGKLPSGEAPEEWIRGVTLLGASALIALDKFPEAEFKLDVAAERSPDLRENEKWKGLRRLARRPPPLEIEVPISEIPERIGRRENGRRRLEQAFPRAIEHLRRRLGVEDLVVPPIQVQVVEVEDWKSENLAETGVWRRGSGWVGLIWVRVEVVESPTMQDEGLLAHEIVHVLHFSGTGNRPSPPWLREGLAHWLEAEDEAGLRERVLERALGVPEKPRPGISMFLQSPEALEAADHESQRVCGAVIFFQLERQLGAAKMRRLVRTLLNRSDYQAVLHQETGSKLDELLGRVRAGYFEWVAATYPGQDELLSASRMATDGKFEESVAALDRLLAGQLERSLRARAELLRINVLLQIPDWTRARAALAPVHALRRTRPLASTVSDGVKSELEILRGSEDWAAVRTHCVEALDSLWVVGVPGAREDLKQALAEAEKHLAETPAPKEPGK